MSMIDGPSIVVADPSKKHSFFAVLQQLNENLLKRFGTDTNIHLLKLKLKRKSDEVLK